MRRKLPAILLLTVFLSLQFGKVASYMYCKWQAEIIQDKTDCGCDDHLVSMFDHKDDASSNNDLAKISLNEKLSEFSPKSFIITPDIFVSIEKCFTEFNSPLSERVIEAPFHPPIS